MNLATLAKTLVGTAPALLWSASTTVNGGPRLSRTSPGFTGPVAAVLLPEQGRLLEGWLVAWSQISGRNAVGCGIQIIQWPSVDVVGYILSQQPLEGLGPSARLSSVVSKLQFRTLSPSIQDQPARQHCMFH